MIKCADTLVNNVRVSYDRKHDSESNQTNQTNTTVLFTESTQVITNRGFVAIEEKMFQDGWDLTHNEMNFISYCKGNYYIEIKVEESGRIYISVPLGTSKYQYLSSCKNYTDACKYILMHSSSVHT